MNTVIAVKESNVATNYLCCILHLRLNGQQIAPWFSMDKDYAAHEQASAHEPLPTLIVFSVWFF
jgi:hypothetical protein